MGVGEDCVNVVVRHVDDRLEADSRLLSLCFGRFVRHQLLCCRSGRRDAEEDAKVGVQVAGASSARLIDPCHFRSHQ